MYEATVATYVTWVTLSYLKISSAFTTMAVVYMTASATAIIRLIANCWLRIDSA